MPLPGSTVLPGILSCTGYFSGTSLPTFLKIKYGRCLLLIPFQLCNSRKMSASISSLFIKQPFPCPVSVPYSWITQPLLPCFLPPQWFYPAALHSQRFPCAYPVSGKLFLLSLLLFYVNASIPQDRIYSFPLCQCVAVRCTLV